MDFTIEKKLLQIFSSPLEIQKRLCKESDETQSKIEELGKQIKSSSEDNDADALAKIFKENEKLIPYFGGYIEDAFTSALYLKNYEVIEYYLENGLDITEGNLSDSLIELVKLSKFNLDEPPIELLSCLLKHGCDPNSFEKTNFRTGMHIAARQGNVQFVRVLAAFGADIDAVDKKKKTPLRYTIEKLGKKPKSAKLIETKEFLESKGAQPEYKGIKA